MAHGIGRFRGLKLISKEDHAEERRALREAHLAVVRELQVRYGFYEGVVDAEGDGEGDEDGDGDGREGIHRYGMDMEHVCVERKLLGEVMGKMPLPGEDDVDE